MDEQNQQTTTDVVEETQQQEQPVEQQAQTPETPAEEVKIETAQNVEYAGFFVRLVALLIDVVIISLVGTLLQIPGFTASFNGGYAAMNASGLLPFIIYGAYFVIMDVKFGQSLGKMAMKIKVQRVDSSENLDFIGAALREYVGRFVCGLTLGLGYLWVIWDPKKQGFHDKIGKSIVVKVKK